MVTFTQDELAQYRETKAKEKAERDRETAKTAEAKAREVSRKRREELEAALKRRFLASGGTELEWVRSKTRLVEDALAKAVLEPEPEPEPKRAPLPMARSKYKN